MTKSREKKGSGRERCYFSPDEFEEKSEIKAIWVSLNKDVGEISDKYPMLTLKTLNEVLKIPCLYDLLKRQIEIDAEDKELLGLVEGTEVYRKQRFDDLNDAQKSNIVYLNRLLLQQTYPDVCPKLDMTDTHPSEDWIFRNKKSIVMFSGIAAVLVIVSFWFGRYSVDSQTDIAHTQNCGPEEHIAEVSDCNPVDPVSELDARSAFAPGEGGQSFESKQVKESKIFVPIVAGQYPIPPHLKRYFASGVESVIITQPFFIQATEVSVGEFRRYTESLDDTARESIGVLWKEDISGNPYNDERPVDYISWENALEYSIWLGRENKWDLKLPTRDQWMAATIIYGEDEPVLESEEQRPLVEIRNVPDHLIGNLREWSSEQCDEHKYFLLGEDYMSNKEAVGELPCMNRDAKWKGAGFRLVRMESLINNQRPAMQKVEVTNHSVQK